MHGPSNISQLAECRAPTGWYRGQVSSGPIVDVIIPIHEPSRPLERALRSLLVTGLAVGVEALITVVCHNTPAAEVRSRLPPDLRTMAQFLEFHDGLPSPAGPRTFALDNTGARYIAFLDSDDMFDPGALSAWVSLAEKHHLDAVIPPERHDTGRDIRTPPVRRFRIGNLHPLRDRLSYRTAPLGLIRRATVAKLKLAFGSGVRNGSDQIFALKLWFDSNKVRFARGAPGYVVGGDAETRVTTQMQPLAAELKSTKDVFGTMWFHDLPVEARNAIAVKFIRLQLFGGIERRLEAGLWTQASHRDAAEFLDIVAGVAPGFERSLSVADTRLCRAVTNLSSSTADLLVLTQKRRAFGRPSTLMTERLRDLLRADAPLRYMVATLLH